MIPRGSEVADSVTEVAPNLVEILAKRRDRVRPVFQQRLDRIEKVRFTMNESICKSHR